LLLYYAAYYSAVLSLVKECPYKILINEILAFPIIIGMDIEDRVRKKGRKTCIAFSIK